MALSNKEPVTYDRSPRSEWTNH